MGLTHPRSWRARTRGAVTGRKQGGTAGGFPLVLAAEHADRPSKLQGGTDGQLYDRNSRPAAPRDPGAPAPDRRGRHLYGGPERRSGAAAWHGPPVWARP